MIYFMEIEAEGRSKTRTMKATTIKQAIKEATAEARRICDFDAIRVGPPRVPTHELTREKVASLKHINCEYDEACWEPCA